MSQGCHECQWDPGMEAGTELRSQQNPDWLELNSAQLDGAFGVCLGLSRFVPSLPGLAHLPQRPKCLWAVLALMCLGWGCREAPHRNHQKRPCMPCAA